MIQFELNGRNVTLDIDPNTPLLWAVREHLHLTGSKFGCGMGLCGACTMHVDGRAVRTCTLPLASVAGKKITTIEGLGGDHPLQKAWVVHSVPQCGYCQSGQIMSAATLLADNQMPSNADIDAAMSGNICRCGTYQRIRRAIRDAAREMPLWLAKQNADNQNEKQDAVQYQAAENNAADKRNDRTEENRQ